MRYFRIQHVERDIFPRLFFETIFEIPSGFDCHHLLQCETDMRNHVFGEIVYREPFDPITLVRLGVHGSSFPLVANEEEVNAFTLFVSMVHYEGRIPISVPRFQPNLFQEFSLGTDRGRFPLVETSRRNGPKSVEKACIGTLEKQNFICLFVDQEDVECDRKRYCHTGKRKDFIMVLFP